MKLQTKEDYENALKILENLELVEFQRDKPLWGEKEKIAALKESIQDFEVRRDSIKKMVELIASGFAGVDGVGTILDRRRVPNLTPIQANGLFNTPSPKPVPEAELTFYFSRKQALQLKSNWAKHNYSPRVNQALYFNGKIYTAAVEESKGEDVHAYFPNYDDFEKIGVGTLSDIVVYGRWADIDV